MDLKFLKPKKKINFTNKEFVYNPVFHWNIILYTSIILILASLAFGAFLFYKENNAINSLDDQELLSKEAILSKEKIQRTLDVFTVREKKSIDILNSVPVLTDQSL